MVTRVLLAALMAWSPLAVATADVLIIAHRGASGHRPEHTLEAYALAIEMGADYVEPDLVATRDGVLVARHENEIGETTDAGARFPDRQRTKIIDGRPVRGWFIEDFSLAEVRQLRARERLPFRSHAFDGQFGIPTFDDVLTLVERQSRERGRPVGVYPELKHPGYFRNEGLALEPRVLEALARHGLTRRTAAVFIQSFEAECLRRLRPLTPLRLIQLLDQDAEVSPARLADISRYADGIGAHTRLIVPPGPDGTLGPSTTLVAEAHRLGLLVHAWTLRSESVFLSRAYDGDPRREYRHLVDLGVDGVFGDFPDVAVAALRRGAR